MRIAIDLMGNDNSPPLLLEECMITLKDLKKEIDFVFIGTKDLKNLALSNNYSFEVANSIVTMDENPLFAIRRKKDSSIAIGMKLLQANRVDALISAGNTGALISSAKIDLPMMNHISRPALLVLLPSKNEPLAILDVGANISYKAQHLIEFAKLGAAFQKSFRVQNPTVGLLNIGNEAKKGTDELKKAYLELSKEKSFKFAGNIEGKEVFDGKIDVLVTDGFTGNVFLKTVEGIAAFLLEKISDSEKNYLVDLKKYLKYDQYPGALLMGVKKTIIKCHSYSTPQTFCRAILGAISFVKKNIVQTIENFLEQDS